MLRGLILLAALASAGTALAQEAREITLFSNEGLSGARFTVTGPRNTLNLEFVPESAALNGGGSWQLCSGPEFTGNCTTVSATTRRLAIGAVRSARPIVVQTSAWREVARLNVRDRADRDLVYVSNRSALYREIKVCAERSTIRIRRAEVQLGTGEWQRLSVPLVLTQGQCSDAIDLLAAPRRLRAVRFEYEAWTAGMERGTITVSALPHVTAQPR